MVKKIAKYFFLGLLCLIILAAAVASPFVIAAKREGDRMYARYDSYTREVLDERVQLRPYPIKTEFQKIHPWKAFKMLKFLVDSRQGERLARVNNIDATMFVFMRMYTLLIRPNYAYNLPMLSVDLIFVGGKRIFVIEVIDPARVEDGNKKTYYDRMRTWEDEVKKFEPMDIEMEWCKDIVTDFSVHIQADRTKDDTLFEIYKTFLDAYIGMAENAPQLTPEMSKKVQEGMEGYVTTLLERGGPAVNVFKQILGPEKQKEYILTVMFGVK